MNVHSYIKAAAVATMIALTVVAAKREAKHPLLVTRVSEIVVMKSASAEEAPVQAPEAKPTLVERAKNLKKEIIEHTTRDVKKDIDNAKKAIVIPHHDNPARTKSADGSGAKWTFPYSCSKVKWYAAHFSQETLEKMRVIAGEPEPTMDQKMQIRDCINGKFQ